MTSLLFLDERPRSTLSRGWTGVKIFLKEGGLHGDWAAVFRNRSVGGSRTQPTQAFSGLRRLGREVVRNSFERDTRYDLAWVYKDPRALAWALEEKSAGRIAKVIAGPLVATLPSEAGGVLLDPRVDAWIFQSGWIRDLFLREAPVTRPAYVYFAGVDSDLWQPVPGTEEPRDILIYRKTVENDAYPAVIQALDARGLRASEVRYGSYTIEDYQKALSGARAVIFLSRTETQGLAMFEAWSMGVPTLHWDPGEMHYLGKKYPGASSCYYLTPECGRRFETPAQLDAQLDALLAETGSLRPRETILRRFTLEHAAAWASQLVDAVCEGAPLSDPSDRG